MENHKSQIVTKDFVFGERALDSPEPRSHSAVALKPLLCIVMPKAEFKAQVLPMMLRRKRARLQYLRDHPFFRTWTELHLSQFNASIQTLQYNPGDSVYKEGHKANFVYLLVNGRLSDIGQVSLHKKNKFPTSCHSWEQVDTER